METISRHAGSMALLVVLLLGFFFLMSYQANRADTVSVVENLVQGVVSPVHRGLSAVWLGLSSGWRRYVGLVGAADRAKAMQQRIAALEREVAALDEAARENSRLRLLLDLKERLPDPAMAAQVIGRDSVHGYESLTLNRGSWDGVAADSAVLSPTGELVGRVVHVASFTSLVQLVTDPESAVGVKAERSGARGVVHGAGGAALQLAYVRSTDDVVEGDVVVTSGDDGIYPAGVPVGRVVRVMQGSPVPNSPRVPLAREEGALFRDITLELLTDVRRVDHVLLLRPLSHGE